MNVNLVHVALYGLQYMMHVKTSFNSVALYEQNNSVKGMNLNIQINLSALIVANSIKN